MTVVKASFVDGIRVPLGGGTITYTPNYLRPSVVDPNKMVTPIDIEAEVAAGIAQDKDLEPGPYSVRIEVEWFLETYPIIVPAAGPVQLIDLIEDSTPYEPPVVSLVKQYRDQAQQASAIAVTAAEGVAGVGEDLEQIALDRAAAEAARDAAQGFAGSASESSGHAAVSAVSAGDSATLAGQRDTSAAGHASNASASATAAGQSESAAAQHEANAETAADLAVSTAAGIQDVAEDAAQVAADRIAVAEDRDVVALDRQAAVDAKNGAITAQGLAEDARDDAAEARTEVDNTKAAIDATLDVYGTQFTADKNASQQAVVDATAQADRAESEADRAEQAADDIAAGAVADGAVTTVKIQDGAVTKEKTSTGVQASLDRADMSVQEGDSRLTNARPPTAHSHPVADVTGLQGALDGKAPTTHTHTEGQITGLTAKLATKLDQAQVQAIANAAAAAVVNGSPAALDTLQELAAALGDDPNFATTITALIGSKAPTVHSHTADDISDATVLGRSLMRASGSITARTLIGAGTGNSNLAIGTTSSTAMRGDGIQAVASLPGSPVSGILYCIPE